MHCILILLFFSLPFSVFAADHETEIFDSHDPFYSDPSISIRHDKGKLENQNECDTRFGSDTNIIQRRLFPEDSNVKKNLFPSATVPTNKKVRSSKESFFKRIITKKKKGPQNFHDCSYSWSHLHDEVRINLFNADITGQEEHHHYAQHYLGLLRSKIEEPGILFPPRLLSRIDCYHRILVCGQNKDFRTAQDEYDFALESTQLVNSIYNKTKKKDNELFNTIEEILGVAASIFAKKARTDERSLQSLERAIELVKSFRTKRIDKGLSFMRVIDVNPFYDIVEEVRYPA